MTDIEDDDDNGSENVKRHPGQVPCPVRLKPSFPKRPESGPPIGVAFSGGGFRATFAALGVARYLADVGLLQNLWLSSSVSGGSVANAILATNWPELRDRGFTAAAVDELVIDPTVKRIAKKSLETHIARHTWRAFGSKTRTDVMAHSFDKWFLGDTSLDQLDPSVRWVINAANLMTGTRFTFERTMVGDYINGYASTNDAKVSLSLATAASAAVPGLFVPVRLKDVDLPCRGDDTVRLLDGGTYDNTALEVMNSKSYKDLFTIVLSAGAIFEPGSYGKIPIWRDFRKVNSMLYRQSQFARYRDMVARFGSGQRKGLLFKLDTDKASVDRALDAAGKDRTADFVSRYDQVDFYQDTELAHVSTTFGQFDEGLSRALIYKGWWTTGLTMAAFHPDMAPLSASTAAPPL